MARFKVGDKVVVVGKEANALSKIFGIPLGTVCEITYAGESGNCYFVKETMCRLEDKDLEPAIRQDDHE